MPQVNTHPKMFSNPSPRPTHTPPNALPGTSSEKPRGHEHPNIGIYFDVWERIKPLVTFSYGQSQRCISFQDAEQRLLRYHPNYQYNGPLRPAPTPLPAATPAPVPIPTHHLGSHTPGWAATSPLLDELLAPLTILVDDHTPQADEDMSDMSSLQQAAHRDRAPTQQHAPPATPNPTTQQHSHAGQHQHQPAPADSSNNPFKPLVDDDDDNSVMSLTHQAETLNNK